MGSLLLSSYMFRHCLHLQGAYTKISLKHIAKQVLLYVSMKSWCKLSANGDNAKTCRSEVTESTQIVELYICWCYQSFHITEIVCSRPTKCGLSKNVGDNVKITTEADCTYVQPYTVTSDDFLRINYTDHVYFLLSLHCTHFLPYPSILRQ